MALAIEEWPLDRVRPYERNPRVVTDVAVEKVAASLKEFGWRQPLVVDEGGTLVVGHTRRLAAIKLGLKVVPVHVARGLSEAQLKAYRIADNRLNEETGWADDLLRLEVADLQAMSFDLGLMGFGEAEAKGLLGEQAPAPAPGLGSLTDRFGVPPFSVLNAREGWWQERKRAWLALGIQSELGRGENLLAFSDTVLEPDPAKREARRRSKISPGGGNGRGSAYGRGGKWDEDRKKGPAAVKAKGEIESWGDHGAVIERNVTKGNGWGNGGPARRDAAFYAKKRAWEKANGRKISTPEFRKQIWEPEQAKAHG